jgi:hypothetical protein
MKTPWPWISLVFFLVLSSPGYRFEALATSLDFTIHTNALSGTASNLAFDLIDGDGVNNNSVTISGFSTDGVLGAASTTGGVSGSLPGVVTITDTTFFNELLTGMTLGTFVKFTLAETANFAGGIPDAFSFFLLDATASFSLTSTNLLGDALIASDFDGTPPGNLSVASVTDPQVAVSLNSQTVPEPSTLILVAMGLCLIAGLRVFGIGAKSFSTIRRP